MEHLVRLYILFQLLLSPSISSTFCGLHYEQPKPNKDSNVPLGYNNVPEVPWLVNIYGNGKRCQGIVLSSWWVLTAANCILLMNPSQVELTESHGHFSTKKVNLFLLHRGFSSWHTAPNNDLGLILLDQSVDLKRDNMQLACVINKKKSYDTKDQCRIFERGDNETTKLLLKSTAVEALSASECSKHWMGTTDELNLCVARKEIPKNRDCRVPVGSSVVCSNLATSKWEVMGIVSQSLHNCSSPILAAQLLTHLKWLQQVGSLENPLQQETELSSATKMVKISSATQQVPTASSSRQTTILLPVANLTKVQQNVTSTTSSQSLSQTTKPENVNLTTTGYAPVVTSSNMAESSKALSEISSTTEQKSVMQTSTVTLPTTIPRQSKPSPSLDTMLAPSVKVFEGETDVNGGIPVHLLVDKP